MHGLKHCNWWFIFILLISCKPVTIEQHKPEVDKTQEALLRINKFLVRRDENLVKSYLERHGWKMTQTQSGLWYMIYKRGKGEKAELGNTVVLKYKVELLDGTLCYSSDSLGYKHFKIGSNEVEVGLDEAIRLLKKGDAARLILLPHLAFGLLGDNNKIPPRSIIIYDVELMDLN